MDIAQTIPCSVSIQNVALLLWLRIHGTYVAVLLISENEKYTTEAIPREPLCYHKIS